MTRGQDNGRLVKLYKNHKLRCLLSLVSQILDPTQLKGWPHTLSFQLTINRKIKTLIRLLVNCRTTNLRHLHSKFSQLWKENEWWKVLKITIFCGVSKESRTKQLLAKYDNVSLHQLRQHWRSEMWKSLGVYTYQTILWDLPYPWCAVWWEPLGSGLSPWWPQELGPRWSQTPRPLVSDCSRAETWQLPPPAAAMAGQTGPSLPSPKSSHAAIAKHNHAVIMAIGTVYVPVNRYYFVESYRITEQTGTFGIHLSTSSVQCM